MHVHCTSGTHTRRGQKSGSGEKANGEKGNTGHPGLPQGDGQQVHHGKAGGEQGGSLRIPDSVQSGGSIFYVVPFRRLPATAS